MRLGTIVIGAAPRHAILITAARRLLGGRVVRLQPGRPEIAKGELGMCITGVTLAERVPVIRITVAMLAGALYYRAYDSANNGGGLHHDGYAKFIMASEPLRVARVRISAGGFSVGTLIVKPPITDDFLLLLRGKPGAIAVRRGFGRRRGLCLSLRTWSSCQSARRDLEVQLHFPAQDWQISLVDLDRRVVRPRAFGSRLAVTG